MNDGVDDGIVEDVGVLLGFVEVVGNGVGEKDGVVDGMVEDVGIIDDVGFGDEVGMLDGIVDGDVVGIDEEVGVERKKMLSFCCFDAVVGDMVGLCSSSLSLLLGSRTKKKNAISNR